MPATMGYLAYLIYGAITNRFFPLISLVLLVAGYGLQVVIFMLKKKWEHIGWLIIYILALPFFTFIIPIYSFWRFDDFSWGSTRVVVGEKGGKKHIVDEEPFDPKSIPMKKWSEYEQEMFEKGSQIGSFVGSQAPPGYEMSQVSSQHSQMMSMMQSQIPSQLSQQMMQQQMMQQQMLQQQAMPRGRPISMMPQQAVSSEPTDEQISAQIRSILATANLMTITKKQVRDDLSLFFGVDMTPRKEFINKVIEDVLQGRA